MKAFLRQTWSRIRNSAQPSSVLPADVTLPKDSVRIRPMQVADLEQVHTVDQLSFSLPWPLSSYRFELLENQTSMLWVAEAGWQDGKKAIVGMIVMWLLVDEAHIATIAVHPDYRGRGIGRQILVYALQEAARRGAEQATLEVRVGNTVAQKLYREFGFRVAGRRARYYQDNFEDALIMTLDSLNLDKLYQLALPSSSSSKEEST